MISQPTTWVIEAIQGLDSVTLPLLAVLEPHSAPTHCATCSLLGSSAAMFRRRWQRQKISASPKRIGAGEFSILGGGGGGRGQRPTFSSAANPVRGAAAGPGRCPAARERPQRPWRARFLSS